RSRSNASSVSRSDWCAVTAEAIVDAQGDHVHVLGDPVVEKSGVKRIEARERIIGIAHEQMVVFNAERPVRCKAVLKSNAHGATPAGRTCRRQFKIVKRREDAKAVAGHRRATLYVEQRCVPGVADLARKEADAIGLGAKGEPRIEEADALVAEIRPI